jgi:hypothetical protein
MGQSKKAGATLYLQEELSNARLYCEDLKRMVTNGLGLVEVSADRDHIFAVAGDLLYSIPDIIMKLEHALNSAAMAVNKIDNSELSQVIRPDKVDELERVLDEIRIRLPRRV